VLFANLLLAIMLMITACLTKTEIRSRLSGCATEAVLVLEATEVMVAMSVAFVSMILT
jgi:hypothetical protein